VNDQIVENCLGTEIARSSSSEVFTALFELARYNAQLTFKLMSEHGFYPGQAVAMVIIDQKPGISQKELANAMHVAPPTVVHIIKKLEKAGFVSKMINEKDQRSLQIQLTPAGIDAVKNIRSVFQEIFRISLDGISDEQRKELVKLLNMITSNMRKYIGTGGESVNDKVVQ
jgi:DNA-binding MarR family transcriptional regulator